MAPFVVASACARNHRIDKIKHGARSRVVGLHNVPIPARHKHDVLLRAVRDVRGGGGGGDGAAADNNYEKYLADTDADNNFILDSDVESDNFHDNRPPTGTGTSSPPPTSTPTTGTDEANSIIASFEEELVRIRLQIEAEAEQEWEVWRKQMLERRRVRKRLLQSNVQKQEEGKEEEEKVEAEPEVCAETDTFTSTNADQYEDENMESPLVDESEGTALDSDIILFDDDEEKQMEEEKEEESITSSRSQDTDAVDEVAPLGDEDGNNANLEDSSQIQDNVDCKEEDESGYDEQTTMDDYSEEAFGIGNIGDGNQDDSDAQENIGFIGDYDAPTDSDDELSGYEEEEAFEEEYEKRVISVHSEGSDKAARNMEVESDYVDDSNVPVERQVSESGDLACNIPKKRRKQKKKKKKKKRKKSQRETAQAEKRSDDTGRTSLIQADVALAPSKEYSSALSSPAFTRKFVFYVGFAAFLSLFKMILDALVRMGLQ